MSYFLLGLFFSSGCNHAEKANAQSSPQEISQPSLVDIDNIETLLVMPERSYPLTSYKRYYAKVIIENDDYIVGTFKYDNICPGVLITSYSDFPIFLHGGCNIVNLKFSVKDNKIIAIRCGGF